MTTLLFSLALIVLTVALIAMLMTAKHLKKEIDEIKEKLKLEDKNRVEKYLNFFSFSEHERRLEQLEDALGINEYFDEEPLDEEDNE